MGITHDHARLVEIFSNRVRSFQKTTLFKVQRYLNKFKDLDLKSNMSLLQIETLMRRLRLGPDTQGTLSETETLSIYSQVMRYL